MPNADVNVGSSTEARSHVVNVVVHVLVNARLQAERTDDAGVVVFLAGFDEFLTEFKRLLEQGLTNGRCVVPNDGHFRNLLMGRHRHLLWGRKPHMTVE